MPFCSAYTRLGDGVKRGKSRKVLVLFFFSASSTSTKDSRCLFWRETMEETMKLQGWESCKKDILMLSFHAIIPEVNTF